MASALGNDSTSELEPLTDADEESSTERSRSSSRSYEFRAYKERWYILITFSVINAVQSAVYNTFGPISTSSVLAFNLTQTDVALLPNWANIVYFFSIGPFVYLINSKGLRLPVIITAAFVWAGCAARLLHFGDDYRAFLHIGQFLNSFAGPVTFFACTAVSSVWFPPNERTLATAVSFLTGNLGTGFSFVVGPLFVRWFASNQNDAKSVRHSIISLLTFEYLIASVILVMVIYSFRSKPPTPPSFTASMERSSFKTALINIFSSRGCWFSILAYSVSSGMWGGWISVLSWVIRERVEEVEAGWIGLASQVAGAIAGILISAFAGRFQHHTKAIILVTFILCCFMMTWHVITFNLLTSLYSRQGLWLCIVGTAAALTCSQPLLWELSCEFAYPAPESLVSAILTIGNSFVSAALLVIAMAPSLGTAWMDWALVGSFWICIPFLIFYRPVHRRSALDV